MTSRAAIPPRVIEITAGLNIVDAWISSSIVPARVTARRIENDDLFSTATRSWSSTIPMTRPVGEVTGKCLTPRSSMSRSTSLPGRSPGTVNAGAVMTSDTGESLDKPPATTRERRSASVTIPSEPPRSTIRAVAPAAVMRWAASRRVVPGSQMTGELRTAPRTG